MFKSLMRWLDSWSTLIGAQGISSENKQIQWVRILPFILLHIACLAVLFGEADRFIILTLQSCALFCLLLAGNQFALGSYFQLGLVGAAACFIWEFNHTRQRDAQSSLQAFLHNHWAGFCILLGIMAHYAFAA